MYSEIIELLPLPLPVIAAGANRTIITRSVTRRMQAVEHDIICCEGSWDVSRVFQEMKIVLSMDAVTRDSRGDNGRGVVVGMIMLNGGWW